MKKNSFSWLALLPVVAMISGVSGRCAVSVGGDDGVGDTEEKVAFGMFPSVPLSLPVFDMLINGVAHKQSAYSLGAGTSPVSGQNLTDLTVQTPVPTLSLYTVGSQETVNLGDAAVDGRVALNPASDPNDPLPSLEYGTVGDAPIISPIPECQTLAMAAMILLPLGLRSLQTLRARNGLSKKSVVWL